MNIWRLWVGGKANLALIPHNLEYFSNHFIGERLGDAWTPPPVSINGKSKKLRDFVSWMERAPVVSQRARQILEPLLGDNVEFLKFHEILGKSYFALNVLRLENILDRDQSEVLYADEAKRNILRVSSFFLREEQLSVPTPRIFKLSHERNSIFVSNNFADVVIDNKLTGLALVDPRKNIYKINALGGDLNDVAGVKQ